MFEKIYFYFLLKKYAFSPYIYEKWCGFSLSQGTKNKCFYEIVGTKNI